jgi:hypothetical protein
MHLYRAATVLDRVCDEIPDHLREPEAVAPNGPRVARPGRAQVDPAGHGDWAPRLDQVRYELLEVHRRGQA